MGFMYCIVLDVYVHKHAVEAVQHAQCEGWLQGIEMESYYVQYTAHQTDFDYTTRSIGNS